MQNERHKMTRFIHWLSAVLVIGLLISGVLMTRGEVYSLYDWHKSFGIISLFIIVVRVFYRRLNPWQSAAQGTPQQVVVNNVHLFILFACVLMPTSGLMLSGFSGHGVALFGMEIISENIDAEGQVIAHSQMGYALSALVHEYLGYVLLLVVGLHIAAALKHHFIDKDHVLRNMLTGKSS
ncbi:cytochrome b (plasmid) [Pseudoalteromonas sp. T1lg65]|uniref:cytochrome b n=1 Tax=Pseudoalteromonas sp. T1lg65 TaxID=2077101 RepID=UPI003F7ABFB5